MAGLTDERRTLMQGERDAAYEMAQRAIEDNQRLADALAASEAEVARLRERISFGNHKRAQCELALAAAEARCAALVEAVTPVIEAWRGSNDDFPVLEILERVKVLSDTLAAQPAAPAPGEADAP